MSDDSTPLRPGDADATPDVHPPAEGADETVRHVSEEANRADAAQDADGQQEPVNLMPTTPPGLGPRDGLGAGGASSPATTGGEALPTLSPEDRRFLEAWRVLGFDRMRVREAAIRSGKSKPTDNWLWRAQRRVAAHVEHARNEAILGAEDVLYQLAEVASLDSADVLSCYVETTTPEGRTVRRWDNDRARELGISRHITGMSRDRQGNDVVQWADSGAARQLLARCLGMTSSDVSVNVDIRSLSIEELRTLADG